MQKCLTEVETTSPDPLKLEGEYIVNAGALRCPANVPLDSVGSSLHPKIILQSKQPDTCVCIRLINYGLRLLITGTSG